VSNQWQASQAPHAIKGNTGFSHSRPCAKALAKARLPIGCARCFIVHLSSSRSINNISGLVLFSFMCSTLNFIYQGSRKANDELLGMGRAI
jgi:hypothetical protein